MQLAEILTDPYFVLLGPILWVVIYLYFDNPLTDGYHASGKCPLWKCDDLYVILITIPEAIMLSYATRVLLEITGYGGVVPTLGVTHFTVVFALLFVIRFWGVWTTTLENVTFSISEWKDAIPPIIRITGFYVCILFGVGIGVSIYTASHPDPEPIKYLYQRHVTFVLVVLQSFQAILVLSLAHLQPLFTHTWAIFENNVMLGARAATIGAVGGAVTLALLPAILVMAMNAALIWGIFSGLLIRGSLATGGGIFAPVLGYTASLGLLLIGHTFHEFMAIMVMGVGGGIVGYSIVRAKTESAMLFAGVAVFIIGIGQMFAAALLEVFVSPLPVHTITGYVTVETSVVPLEIGLAEQLSILITGAIVAVAVAWMVQFTTRELEKLV